MLRPLRYSLLILMLLPGAAFAVDAFEHATELIGILPLPEIFGEATCERFQPSHIELFDTPATATPSGRISTAVAGHFPAAGGCPPVQTKVMTFHPYNPDEELPTLEYGYEMPGAIVRKRQGEWFEIALGKGYAWIHSESAEKQFLPLGKLFEDALSYLRTNEGAVLFSRPDTDETVWHNDVNNTQSTLPITVLELQEVAGQTWMRITIRDEEPCTGEKTGVGPVSGWLPFHNDSGLPAIWFYSRGC